MPNEGGATHEDMSEINPKIAKIEENGNILIALAGIKDILEMKCQELSVNATLQV